MTIRAEAQLATLSPGQMSDQQILNNTDIGVIDETPTGSTAPGSVAAAYYATKANRDREIAEHYVSADASDPVQTGGEEEVGEGQ
jgi:hypothetical protein